MADGLHIQTVGMVTVPVQIQSYRARLTYSVMDMTPEYDHILGDRWLIKNQAILDYGEQTCSLRQGNRRLVLQTNPAARAEHQNASKILTHLQLGRNLKKGCESFFVMVRNLDREGPEPDADSKMGLPSHPNLVCKKTLEHQVDP